MPSPLTGKTLTATIHVAFPILYVLAGAMGGLRETHRTRSVTPDRKGAIECGLNLEQPEITMVGLASYLLLSAAVFLGAFVSGLAGFAFSAVAGAILLHILKPLEAVPLMMACSVGVQGANLWALRHCIRWKESAILILGGLLGVPLALWLLHNTDPRTFRQVFGLFIAIYSAYMLFKPGLSELARMNQRRTALIGFGGGLIGGLTAMPGALPTIWCDMHGLPKEQQRGLVQPFIAAMQIFALAMMVARHDLSATVLVDLGWSIPALLAGSALGLLAFRRVKELMFRRVILAILLVSGLLLVW